jgi:hypothetical protein
MRIECQCPWCGADTQLRGSDKASWRFTIPCELCSRDMVVSYEAGVVMSRRVDGPLSRSRGDETVRIRMAR